MDLNVFFEKREASQTLFETAKIEREDFYTSYIIEQDNRILAYYRYIELDKYINKALMLNNLNAGISFPVIEEILRPRFDGDNDLGITLTLGLIEHLLIFKKLNYRGEKIIGKLPMILNNPQSIKEGVDLVESFIDQFVKPFFEYWTDIRCFLPFIETDDLQYVANNVFSGYGMRKKMIIWKLCSHPRYEDFVREKIDIYESSIEKSPIDKAKKRNYKDLLIFLKRLEKIKPIYNWDDKYLIAKPFQI